MAPIPKKVKIDHLTYDIVLDPSLTDFEHYGICNLAEQSIRLLSTMNKDRLKETLIHELLHAVYYSRGMKQITGEALTEEYIVDQLGIGLTMLLKVNPQLRKYLLT